MRREVDYAVDFDLSIIGPPFQRALLTCRYDLLGYAVGTANSCDGLRDLHHRQEFVERLAEVSNPGPDDGQAVLQVCLVTDHKSEIRRVCLYRLYPEWKGEAEFGKRVLCERVDSTEFWDKLRKHALLFNARPILVLARCDSRQPRTCQPEASTQDRHEH